MAACSRSLPFPTPGTQELLVLTVPTPLTYEIDENEGLSGLEHDLVVEFAQSLGVNPRFITVDRAELSKKLSMGEGHIAIGWLGPPPATEGKSSKPVIVSRDILIQHEAALPITNLSDLKGRTVHAIEGSRQWQALQQLQQKTPTFRIATVHEQDVYALLERVGQRHIDIAAIDASFANIASQFIPTLQTTLKVSEESDIVWWLGPQPNVELDAQLAQFLDRIKTDGTLARIEDRYYGHVHRLRQGDIVKFQEHLTQTLPRFREHFITAERISGIDWRLIAALAYQESQWDSNATSRTGVRGIMMLTEETADRMEVSNRLNAPESIIAGARYLNLLKGQLEEGIPEPDRTWMAIAAYNLGPGNFSAGRALAKLEGTNPGRWYEMKRILPMLAHPKHANRVGKSRARGGEAVIMVENIRSYYDIISRREPGLPKSIPKTSIKPNPSVGQKNKPLPRENRGYQGVR